MSESNEYNILKLSKKTIYTNYMLLSQTLHTIVKSESKTEEEFDTKYIIYDKLMTAYGQWGKIVQFGTVVPLAVFCLRSKKIFLKCSLTVFYLYQINHFYTLGSHLGVYLNLNWAINKLYELDPERYDTAKLFQEFIKKLNQREELKSKNEHYQSDSELMEEFYIIQAGLDPNSIKKSSRFQNTYFEENNDKYQLYGHGYNTPMYEDRLKVPYVPDALDCFFLRYIYHNSARWTQRLLLFLGIREG